MDLCPPQPPTHVYTHTSTSCKCVSASGNPRGRRRVENGPFVFGSGVSLIKLSPGSFKGELGRLTRKSVAKSEQWMGPGGSHAASWRHKVGVGVRL